MIELLFTTESFGPGRHRMDHRGVIQAQGGNLEASRSWDQATPLPATTGFAHLESLKDEIGKRETELRNEGFIQARKFIDRMLARGGTEQAPPIIRKSYPQPPNPKGRRVDIDVFKGRAFTPDPE
jgi:hypothetical protein